MRIDKLLWFVRLAKTRSAAQALVATGHLRRNGQRVLRTSCEIHPGDVLTLPLAGGVRVIELLAIPHRRGPPAEAAACYRTLDPAAETALAGRQDQSPEGGHRP